MQPVYLFLRPFDIDGKILVPNPEHASFWRKLMPTSSNGTLPYINIEELILQTLDGRGLLIGIGKKTEVIGGGKMLAREDDWRRYFETLAREATCIFSIPSSHPSTLWELEWLAAQSLYARVLMMFTEAHVGGTDERFRLAHLAPRLKRIGWQLPDDLSESSLVTFDKNGSWRHHRNPGHKSRRLSNCIDEVVNSAA